MKLTFLSGGYAFDPAKGRVRARIVGDLLRLVRNVIHCLFTISIQTILDTQCGDIVEHEDLVECLATVLSVPVARKAKHLKNVRTLFKEAELHAWMR